jgi:transposase
LIERKDGETDASWIGRLEAAYKALIPACEKLQEKLKSQVLAQMEFTKKFDEDVRAKFRHFGEELPVIEGPIEQAIGQWANRQRFCVESLKEECRQLHKELSDLQGTK